MKKLVRRYYVLSYFFITMLFSLLLLMLHFIFKSAGDYAISFTQYSPLLATIFMAIIFREDKYSSNIRARFKNDKTLYKWLIVAMLLPVTMILVSSYILTLIDISYVKWDISTNIMIISTITILLGCIAEEIGWRGFLQPKLNKKFTPIITSVIIGLLWGVWHVNFTGGIFGFILYTITMIELSIVMTYIYEKTNGNMYLMIIIHFCFNLSSRFILWDRFSKELYLVQAIVFGVVSLLIIILDRKMILFKKPVQPSGINQ